MTEIVEKKFTEVVEEDINAGITGSYMKSKKDKEQKAAKK